MVICHFGDADNLILLSYLITSTYRVLNRYKKKKLFKRLTAAYIPFDAHTKIGKIGKRNEKKNKLHRNMIIDQPRERLGTINIKKNSVLQTRNLIQNTGLFFFFIIVLSKKKKKNKYKTRKERKKRVSIVQDFVLIQPNWLPYTHRSTICNYTQ